MISYESIRLGVESERSSFSLSSMTSSNIDLSFKVVCAENYYGQDCSRFCNENCSCDPGFRGEFCHEIDHCLGVACSGNGQCMNRQNDYTCVCNPDYTGDNCDVDICQVTNISCPYTTLSSSKIVKRTPFNLTAMLSVFVGTLIIIVLLLLAVIGLMAVVIRKLKKKGEKLIK